MGNRMLPMDLQLFAEPAPAPNPAAAQPPAAQPPGAQAQTLTAPQIDYDKIAQLVAGKQAAAEESVIKGYLKQQGLTKEQMGQAIATFKQQQAASQPDVIALQTQAEQAQVEAQQAQVQAEATMAAVGLGLDAKTIPYVLKMADLSQAMGKDGKINGDAMKTALNKVLDDIPALKPVPTGQAGFVQVGAGGQSEQQVSQADALAAAFGNKK